MFNTKYYKSLLLFIFSLTVGYFSLTAAGCASNSDSSKYASPITVSDKKYHATTFVYSASSAPNVFEKDFDSRIVVDKKGAIISYKIYNYIEDKVAGVTDNTVLLAISGGQAGLGIYDFNNNPIVEYPKGVFAGRAAIFERRGISGRQYYHWLLGSESILSKIESFNSKGVLQYSEVTIYRPAN